MNVRVNNSHIVVENESRSFEEQFTDLFTVGNLESKGAELQFGGFANTK